MVPVKDLRLGSSPRRELNFAQVATLAELDGEWDPILVQRRSQTVVDGCHHVGRRSVSGTARSRRCSSTVGFGSESRGDPDQRAARHAADPRRTQRRRPGTARPVSDVVGPPSSAASARCRRARSRSASSLTERSRRTSPNARAAAPVGEGRPSVPGGRDGATAQDQRDPRTGAVHVTLRWSRPAPEPRPRPCDRYARASKSRKHRRCSGPGLDAAVPARPGTSAVAPGHRVARRPTKAGSSRRGWMGTSSTTPRSTP